MKKKTTVGVLKKKPWYLTRTGTLFRSTQWEVALHIQHQTDRTLGLPANSGRRGLQIGQTPPRRVSVSEGHGGMNVYNYKTKDPWPLAPREPVKTRSFLLHIFRQYNKLLNYKLKLKVFRQ